VYKLVAIAGTCAVMAPSLAFGQDVMQYGVRHLKVLAEDQKVRVLKYTPLAGEKTPMHSHPATVVYVIKGGRMKVTLPDGTSTVVDLKAGVASLRAPVTHSDEALDDLESVLIELKQ
jgi:quercetin dioxygenase-like cupin family protein